MEITFEVTLDYGDDGPGEGEPSPTDSDVARATSEGLQALGFPSLDVTAQRL